MEPTTVTTSSIRRRATTVVILALLVSTVLVQPAFGSGAVQVDKLRGFESVVATAIDETEEFGVDLMSMECSLLIRWEYVDGTSRERQICQVVDALTDGAAPPTRGIFIDDEPCVWYSDWHLNTTGEDFVAERFASITTPSGRVVVESWYGVDPLPEGCDEL